MKKSYAICAGELTTIGEFKKLIEDVPDDYFINCCGENKFFINVCPSSGDVCIDTVKVSFEEVICSYDNFKIIERGEETIYIDEEGERLIECVFAVPVGELTEEQLINGYGFSGEFDVSGELDDARIYCYWCFI